MIYCINKSCTVNDFCNTKCIENSIKHVTKYKHKFSHIMTACLNQTNEIRRIVTPMQYTKKVEILKIFQNLEFSKNFKIIK